MAPREDHRLPDDLYDVAARLRQERAEATPLELDRMKLLAMKRAAGPASGPRARKGFVRSRLVSPVLAAALLIGGVAALAGSTGGPPISLGGSNASSVNSQYCPASSPGAGKEKKQPGGNKCGQAP
ncbi:MAG: hypothetical protein ACRDLQ_08910 [Solirubrobacterales bacterium]